jgi:hypothetical protein
MTLKDNPMVEKVARALHAEDWPDVSGCETWEELCAEYPDEADDYRKAARVAISLTLEGAARVAEAQLLLSSPCHDHAKRIATTIAQSLRSMIPGEAE